MAERLGKTHRSMNGWGYIYDVVPWSLRGRNRLAPACSKPLNQAKARATPPLRRASVGDLCSCNSWQYVCSPTNSDQSVIVRDRGRLCPLELLVYLIVVNKRMMIQVQPPVEQFEQLGLQGPGQVHPSRWPRLLDCPESSEGSEFP